MVAGNRSLRPLANWLAVFFLCCGCHRTQKSYSDADAVIVAVQAFEKAYPGRLPYFSISIVDDPDYAQWNVWFNPGGKFADPGGYTLVRVKKATGKWAIEPSF